MKKDAQKTASNNLYNLNASQKEEEEERRREIIRLDEDEKEKLFD